MILAQKFKLTTIIEINYEWLKSRLEKKVSHRKKRSVLVNFHTDISSCFDSLLIRVTRVVVEHRGRDFYSKLFFEDSHMREALTQGTPQSRGLKISGLISTVFFKLLFLSP